MGFSLGVPTGPNFGTKPQQHEGSLFYARSNVSYSLRNAFPFPLLSGTQWPPSRQQFRVSTSHASLRHTSPGVTLHDVQRHSIQLHGEPWLAARRGHPAVPPQLRHPRLAGIQGHADSQGGQPLCHGLRSLMQELVQEHHELAGSSSPEPSSRTALFMLAIPGISPHDLSPVRLLGLKELKTTSETERSVVLRS